jgi:putative flippase GtrA
MNKATLHKLLRYFLTAGVAAIVDVGGFALLTRTALPVAVSAVASFGVATIVNYILTSHFVFKNRPTIRGYGLFFLAAVGGLIVNVSVTLIGTLYLGVQPVLAKLVGVGIAFLVNFWLNLRIVFRPSAGSPN